MPHSPARALVRLLPFAYVLLAGLVLLSLSRLALAGWHADAVTAAQGWMRVVVQGVRVDIATLCLLLGLPAAVYVLLPARLARHAVAQVAVAAWLTLALAVLLTLEAATPAFMAEYGLRPNRLFVEYLAYPREISATLAKGHRLTTLLTLAVAGFAAWWGYGRVRAALHRHPPHPGHPALRAVGAALVVVLAALGVRSTLGHRPMNPAMVAFSSNATVNALPLNSFYSLAFATRSWLRHDPGSRVYDDSTPDTAVAAAMRAEALAWPGAHPADDRDAPLMIRRTPVHTGAPRNLVIVLEESLGAQFVGRLGGRPMTPRLDRLARKGWAFERLYATGTRSVRGIEAVLAGFPPTPSPSTVKRPLAQGGFFTVAKALKDAGYDTAFHYGGESHFDNMRGFFLANGFDRIIDQDDHPAPVFTGAWGVSDEDVFNRAHEDFMRLQAAGQPFFGLVFTSSNHDPFEFPDGRIDTGAGPKATRDNAARYADHALGGFFDRAMASPYWDDTVFLIVADHDSRVFGRSLVPVDNFHIPGLILGAGVTPRRDARVASQVDLAPTLLSLVGVDSPTPLMGRDLNRDDPSIDGRALMQYDGNFALMTDTGVTVLQPGRPARGFHYTSGQPLAPAGPVRPDAERRARMHALWGTVAYEHRWHRLPTLP